MDESGAEGFHPFYGTHRVLMRYICPAAPDFRRPQAPVASVRGSQGPSGRLQPLISKLTTEQVRIKLGDGEGSGALRRDLGHIKSGKAERIAAIGFERLLYMCHRFSVDPVEALTGVAGPRVH